MFSQATRRRDHGYRRDQLFGLLERDGMTAFDLYGMESSDIKMAKAVIEDALGITFTPKESAYHGEYYQWGDRSTESLMLKMNADPIDDEPAEPDFPSFHILLYVDGSERHEEIGRAIDATGAFVLLRHEELD